MMRTAFLLGIIALLSLSCNNSDQNSLAIDMKDLEKELEASIESRFLAWQNNDYESYIAGYHVDWKRWGMRKDELNSYSDIRGFWDNMKANEESLGMEVNLVDYDLLDNGNIVFAHYTSAETFKWIGPDNQRGWKTGDIYKGFARWSDVLIKEGDKWLCIGGHRDRSQSTTGLIKLN